MAMIVDGIHAIRHMMGITRQKFMLGLCRPFAGMSKRKQVMPTLHFLQKQDVWRHGGDSLLDAMHSRPGTHRADTFVNIPGSDAKFHSERVQKTGLQMLWQLENRFGIGW
jgi:hypothetical protein